MPSAIKISAAEQAVSVIDWPGDPDQHYAILSDAVGGYIECVTMHLHDRDGVDVIASMWVNEEGKLDGLPHNELATRIFTSQFHTLDRIVGDVIITGGADEEGDALGLDDTLALDLATLLIEAGA